MASTPTSAVHRTSSGADTQINQDGDTTTPIVYNPAVPVRSLSAARLHIPGGRSTTPQRHANTETVLAIIGGYSAVLSGPNFRTILPQPGDLIYIPPNIPYIVANLSLNASVLILAFRTDPGFTTDVQLLPDLKTPAAGQIEQLRAEHLQRLMSRRTGRVRRPR